MIFEYQMCIIIIKCSKGECKDSKEYEFVAIEITLGMCRRYLVIYNENRWFCIAIHLIFSLKKSGGKGYNHYS